MSAQATGDLPALWHLRDVGLQEVAPVLVQLEIRGVEELASRASAIIEVGVAPWQVELLASGHAGASDSGPSRWDCPTVRPTKRACFQKAMDAALPANRRRCIESLEADILAHTARPATDSKVRSYVTLCHIWQVREGGYTSAQTYFQAIFSHQRRTLQVEVLQIIKHTAKDYARSIGRGLGPAALKDSFDVELLTTIPVDFTETPFRFSDPRHGRDILVVGCWFMLRELELAACRCAHVYVENGSLHVLVPVQKNDTAGALTVRSLLCACRSRYKGEDIILLSFCDGVASARLALQLLVGTPCR